MRSTTRSCSARSASLGRIISSATPTASPSTPRADRSPKRVAAGAATYTGLLLGVGVEYALDAHWSVKGEYDYINYGSKNVAMTGNFDYIAAIKNYENIVKVGANYRF